jgi:uncharacterized protein (DUF2141 family)
MRVGRCLVTVATLLLPVVGSAQIPPQPPALGPGTGLIVGQVIDATTGKGLGGAVVALAGARRVMTTAEGRFVLRNVPQGSHNLTATKSGYIDGAFGTRRPGGPTMDLTMADGERRGDIVIRLWRHGTISGTVADEMGEPLIGIQVTSLRRTDAGGRRRFIPGIVATTDDRGMYRLTRLTPGDYVVAIVSAQVTVSAATAQQYQEGMMTAGPDLSRNAIAQIMVQSGATMAIAGGPDSREIDDHIQTMSRSAPTPPPIAGSRVFVYPTHFYPSTRSIASATIVTVGSAQERTGIDLQVKPVPAVKVSGTVAGLAGPSGVVAMRLVATAPRTAPAGWFLKGAFLGERDLSDSPLELESADVSDVVLSFTDRPASISGTVEVNTQIARDGVAVIVFPADSKAWFESGVNPRRLRRVATTDSGAYQVQSLPAGVYYVAAVREAAASDWLDPKILESLATGAAHVQIGDGEKIAQNLRLQEVR